MHRADKAVYRLAFGLGGAVCAAYGLALPMPHLICILTVILLCKPAPPMPPLKGVIAGLIIAAMMALGILMVPLLEHYAFSGVIITALVLFLLFFKGLQSKNPIFTLPVIAFALIPIAGVQEQALGLALAQALGLGIAFGAFINIIAHALFPDTTAIAAPKPVANPSDSSALRWVALRAVVIVMPMWLLALTNPSLYIAGVMKTVTLGQQACSTRARDAGRELVGSTLMGALIAAILWTLLRLMPNLWMLTLLLTLCGFWIGRRLLRLVPSRYGASFWSNALITALILFGPAIADSQSGKDVFTASLLRLALFLAVALYAWLMVAFLERWSARRRQQRLVTH